MSVYKCGECEQFDTPACMITNDEREACEHFERRKPLNFNGIAKQHRPSLNFAARNDVKYHFPEMRECPDCGSPHGLITSKGDKYCPICGNETASVRRGREFVQDAHRGAVRELEDEIKAKNAIKDPLADVILQLHRILIWNEHKPIINFTRETVESIMDRLTTVLGSIK